MSFVNTLKKDRDLENRFFTKIEPLLVFILRFTTSHQHDYQPYKLQPYNLKIFHESSFKRESFSGSKNQEKIKQKVYHEKKAKNIFIFNERR